MVSMRGRLRPGEPGRFLSANDTSDPDFFRGVIAMSGSYDIRSYLDGYYDDNVFSITR